MFIKIKTKQEDSGDGGRGSCVLQCSQLGGGLCVSWFGFLLVVHKNKNRGARPVVLISVGAIVRAEIGEGFLAYYY